jgi:hypothetical protein
MNKDIKTKNKVNINNSLEYFIKRFSILRNDMNRNSIENKNNITEKPFAYVFAK